jgi:predicted secreted acid phosphatase
MSGTEKIDFFPESWDVKWDESHRLRTAIGLLSGRIEFANMDDFQCRQLGYHAERRNYDSKDVTADTVVRLSNPREARKRAENIVISVISALMHFCNEHEQQQKKLLERIEKLEAANTLALEVAENA